MKVILTESQIKRVLEQKNDLITSLKEMGFIPSGNGIFKHSQKPELTVTLSGDIVIVKNNGVKIAEIKTSEIEDLEGTIKSTSLKEQVAQGAQGDPYEYKKEGDVYYARKKGSQKWIKTSGKMADAISKKIFTKPTQVKKSTQVKTEKQYCPAHPKSSDVNPALEKNYQTEAAKLIGKGIPTRTSCEISFIKLRPKFSNKSFFVFDSLQNLIYLFDKAGNFVAKSYVLDGADAQSQNSKKIAQALWSWQQQVENMGFKYDPKQKNIWIRQHKKDNILVI
jgi:hypothetical protein